VKNLIKLIKYQSILIKYTIKNYQFDLIEEFKLMLKNIKKYIKMNRMILIFLHN
jgi:hypothetical protein